MNKSKFSLGNRALRERNVSSAMQFFLEALRDRPEFFKIIDINIRQTRKTYKKEISTAPFCYLVTSARSSESRAKTAIDVRFEGSSIISFCGSCVDWDGEKKEFDLETSGTFFSNMVVQAPAKYVYVEFISSNSLLVALLFRLIWKAQVMIIIDELTMVAVDKYFEQFSQSATLAEIAVRLDPCDLLLIKSYGETATLQTESRIPPWPYRYARLGQVYDSLMGGTDERFLNNLFEMVLNRKIQSHENTFYREQLVAHGRTRKYITDTVVNGDECKRYQSDRAHSLNRPQTIYRCPVIGDINPADIDLPFHKYPTVSVLIPVYGKIEYTLACLQSISDYPPQASFEVIVMDDQSSDDSVKILQQVKNLRVIINPENLGFLRSCNNGSSQAHGEYLFFLNNDTQVKSGWLDELLATFTVFPNCGLAGSKLIYPDGSLQEAGGIVWQDGSAWNYGSLQDPALPEFNYAREVDYISGAAILVPTELFRDMGCFDERYAPAYYEDTDLAMRMRVLGKSVIYQPLSEVVHFEGISSGTDTAQGVKAYQVLNQDKFFQRWKDCLASHAPNGTKPHLERNRGYKGSVLFIDACTPTPDQDSGSVDIDNLMKVFIEMGWAVTFIPEDNNAYIPKYTPALQRQGVYTLYSPYVNTVDEHISFCGDSYDLVMSFRPTVTSKNLTNLRAKCTRAKIVFNTVDLHFLRLEREAQLKGDSLIAQEAKRLKKIELELMKKVDLTTVVSSVELELLKKMGVQRAIHLPFSRKVRQSKVPFEERSGILYVGGFQHNPNVDAVHYFVTEIMPLLRRSISTAKFHIVGSNMPKEIQDLTCDDIVAHGYIEDLESFMDTMRVNVAPLRYGAGTKGKVIHALANGLPTVATSIAIEGMGLKDMKQVSVADQPGAFAERVIDTYSDSELWSRLSEDGIGYIKNNYDLDVLKHNISINLLGPVLGVLDRAKLKTVAP
jgi:GT2 family glycosyltransferase/glycosyltransferase involved in cell wall biosynthesis